MSQFKLKKGINHCTNEEYHGDKSYLSSSNLKLILKDPEQFYKEIVLGERDRKHIAAFDEGSYAHSLILEPHMVEKEYAFFPEWRKAGKVWEAFKQAEENQGKIILSVPQKKRVEQLIEAYSQLSPAVDLITGGESEYTVAGELMGLKLKARADYINLEEGYIADVKTTGYSADHDTFSYTIDRFGYDLSAGLYTMLFEQHYGKPFDFYFIVLSKKEKTCEVYKASSETMERGRAAVVEAVSLIKKCQESGNWDLANNNKQDRSTEDYEILEI